MKEVVLYLFAIIFVLPFAAKAKTFLVETSNENNPPIPKKHISRGKIITLKSFKSRKQLYMC